MEIKNTENDLSFNITHRNSKQLAQMVILPLNF